MAAAAIGAAEKASPQTAEASLARCRDLIQTALEKKRLKLLDPLVVAANTTIADLDKALADRSNLRREVADLARKSSSKDAGLFIGQVQNFMSHFGLLRASKATTSAQKSLVRTDKKVNKLQKQLEKQKVYIEEKSSRNSCYNPLGSFYNLVDNELLVAADSDVFRLKGRFAETGEGLYDVGCEILSAGKSLEDRYSKKSKRPWDNESSILSLWITAQKRLAEFVDHIILYMLKAPFDIESHVSITQDTEKVVGYLKKYALGDNSVSLEVLEQQLGAIELSLNEKDKRYCESAQKFALDIESTNVPANERSFDHLDLKKGDLSETPIVVHRMSDVPEKNCLGLPILHSNPPEKTGTRRSGGYGSVYMMVLPDGVVGSNVTRIANRRIAVKVLDRNCDKSEKNLRMLREAESWTAVRRESMDSVSGAEYIAEVFGIWDNFTEGRPGLISLWGDHDLAMYLKEINPSERQRAQILHKIAQGVNFLHTRHKPIAHGDLKAKNVIMVDGDPILTDFGVAKCLQSGVKGMTTGNATYTEGYRAPELQYRSISLVKYPTTMSDVYAFGCVVLETISGNPPYEGYEEEEARNELFETYADCTPVQALAEIQRKRETPFVFKDRPLELKLLNECFSFHACKRPSMSKVVEDLQNICLAFKD